MQALLKELNDYEIDEALRVCKGLDLGDTVSVDAKSLEALLEEVKLLRRLENTINCFRNKKPVYIVEKTSEGETFETKFNTLKEAAKAVAKDIARHAALVELENYPKLEDILIDKNFAYHDQAGMPSYEIRKESRLT